MINRFDTRNMPTEALGIQYVEDTPTESSSNGNLSATSVFRGPSKNRFAFIRFIMGYSYESGVGEITVVSPITYPDNPTLVASSWSIRNMGRPVDFNTGAAITDLADPVAGECNKLDCEITVTYEQPQLGSASSNGSKNDGRLPTPELGTVLTVEESWGIEQAQVELAGLKVKKGQGFAAEEKESKPEHAKVNVTVHTINVNWSSALAPDWDKIYEYMGTINNAEWYGYPKYAVRLEGMNKTSRLNVSNAWVYDIKFTFIAKTVASRGFETLASPGPTFVKNGRIGVWNRIWLPEVIPTTSQHWWWWGDETSGDDAMILGSGKVFDDLFQYNSTTFPSIIVT